MRDKMIGVLRPWRSHPELGLAAGWAVICGVLWLAVRMLGLA